MLYGEDVPELNLALHHHDVWLGLHTGPGNLLQAETWADTGCPSPVNSQYYHYSLQSSKLALTPTLQPLLYIVIQFNIRSELHFKSFSTKIFRANYWPKFAGLIWTRLKGLKYWVSLTQNLTKQNWRLKDWWNYSIRKNIDS